MQWEESRWIKWSTKASYILFVCVMGVVANLNEQMGQREHGVFSRERSRQLGDIATHSTSCLFQDRTCLMLLTDCAFLCI